MSREEIIQRLHRAYQEFSDYILSLEEKEFMFSPEPGKWTSGQQAEHILKSTKPLILALSLPGWFLKLYVGKANRPSRTYDELVERYKSRLSQGGAATNPYIPNEVFVTRQKEIEVKIRNAGSKLSRKLEKYSEKQLDELILPHPLMGKLTLREMMYFAIYHVMHHQNSIAQNLKAMDAKSV